MPFRFRLMVEISCWRFSDPAGRTHQLQVVDDDQPQPVLLLSRRALAFISRTEMPLLSSM